MTSFSVASVMQRYRVFSRAMQCSVWPLLEWGPTWHTVASMFKCERSFLIERCNDSNDEVSGMDMTATRYHER